MLRPLAPDALQQWLSQLSPFEGMTAAHISFLCAESRQVVLQRNEILFVRGAEPSGFYFVVSGLMRLYVSSPDGYEKIVEIITPTTSFGEAVMFLERPYPVSAQAMNDTLLVHIDRDAVFSLLSQDVSFSRRLLANMSIRLHTLLADVESYSLHSSRQRVIAFLLNEASDHMVRSPASNVANFTLSASKQAIASRISLTPETFSRILRELSEDGLIAVNRRRITLCDVAALHALVE